MLDPEQSKFKKTKPPSMYMEEHGSRGAEDPSKTPIFYTYSYPHDQHAAAVEDSGHNPFPEGEYPSGYVPDPLRVPVRLQSLLGPCRLSRPLAADYSMPRVRCCPRYPFEMADGCPWQVL